MVIRRNPMARLLGWRTLRLLLGLLALVEAHFIADSMATLIEIVVRNGGTVIDAVLLIALTSPQVIDFALPLAVLIGLFFAISTARENNELVAFAAAGVPWTRIPGFALRVGLLGCLASLLFAGFLTPMANYAKRLAVHGMEARSILAEMADPSPRNSLRTIKNRTVIATPSETEDAKRGNLFVFEPDSGLGWRASQASDWTVEGPGPDGAYSIRMMRFRDFRERRAPDPDAAPETADSVSQQLEIAKINVQSLALDFRLEEVVRAIDRTRRSQETVLFSAAAVALYGSDALRVDRRFGEVVARALLCFFAAGVAVAATAATGGRLSRMLALPVAVVVVLGADVGARAVLGDAAAVGPAAFWSALAIAVAGAILLPLLYLAKRREAIITPRRGRA